MITAIVTVSEGSRISRKEELKRGHSGEKS